ncbi:MAG: hypothetical protein RL329_3036 [Bacteroidota bacterium]|jgi:cytochrome P450
MKDIKGCPYHQKIANEFQPFDLSNPYPFYQKAREEAPIFYNPELKYWVVTRYAEIKEIFTNWKVFLSDNAQVPLRPILPKAKAIMEAGDMVGLSGLSGIVDASKKLGGDSGKSCFDSKCSGRNFAL